LALIYYITARAQLEAETGSDAASGSEQALREKVQAAFSAGVDTVQVREKDLPDGRLARLVEDLGSLRAKTERAKTVPEKTGPEKAVSRWLGRLLARLLINERLDIALSCGADGVHLPSDSLPLSAVRSRVGPDAVVGISCHTREEVEEAARDGADYALLGPVFETPSKPGSRPLGLAVLEDICRSSALPVFALGGVTRENAASCVRAGASGIAGIRLFQQAPDLEDLCRYLHSL